MSQGASVDRLSGMDTDRTIVIGGGLAGLTAAATLARAGRPVTVVEGAEHLGGRARSRHRDGFDVNLGPHALYRTAGGLDVLRRLGVAVRGRRPRLDRAGVFVGGEIVPAWRHLRRDVGDRVVVAKAMAGLGERASSEWAGRPVEEWIDSVTDDPAGRAALASVVRTATYSADRSLLDAGAATAQLRAAAHGVLYLHHGWSSLVVRLAAIVRGGGGEIVADCIVDAVEHDDRVRAVRLLDGRTLAAAAVVVAVNDPRRAAGLLDGDTAARVAAVADEAIPIRMAHLDVALRPLVSTRFPNLLGIDEPIYLTVPSSVADCAPADGGVVQVGRYLRPGEERADHRSTLEGVLDLHQPNWRDHVVDARYVPRSPVSGDHARVATNGVVGRPRIDVAGVTGLAIAGDWVGPTGTLADASIVSGAMAATAVARDMLEGVRPSPVRS
jgi:phytoene dehydrogenase-like protein